MLGRRGTLAAMASLGGNARAQPAWPDRPVRVLVPFAAGGNTDGLARVTAELLAEALGQPFVVENRTGAGGLIAAEATARAAPDGTTLLMVAVAVLAVAPLATAQPPRFDPVADFTPVSLVATNPFVLLAHRELGVADVPALIALGRARDGQFAYASGGVGSLGHLAMELFLQRAGFTATHVPYRGGAPALADVLGGRVPLLFANLSEALPHAANPMVRLLGISSAARAAALPNLPTVAEGGLPGFETLTWNGLIGPARLPPWVAPRVHAALAARAADPAVRARYAALGAELVAEGPEAFGLRIRADVQRWGALIRDARIQLQ